jgi:predicted deacylase
MNQLRHVGVLDGPVERRAGQVLMRDMKVMRPRHGGICVPRTTLSPGQVLPAGTALADIVSPYTFEVLETMTVPLRRQHRRPLPELCHAHSSG